MVRRTHRVLWDVKASSGWRDSGQGEKTRPWLWFTVLSVQAHGIPYSRILLVLYTTAGVHGTKPGRSFPTSEAGKGKSWEINLTWKLSNDVGVCTSAWAFAGPLVSNPEWRRETRTHFDAENTTITCCTFPLASATMGAGLETTPKAALGEA